MKNQIANIINSFISKYRCDNDISTNWGEPLVGFADANHPDILNLPNMISPKHGVPSEVVDDASIVIAYFIPFTGELAETNRISRETASAEWALAYEETNTLLSEINSHLIKALKQMGYNAGISPKASVFDKDKLISHWSHRHFAKAAGLGTFGLNNMLITKTGCCGRYSTVVTNLDIEPDAPLDEEYCLYKKNGICKVCINNCPSGALTVNGFDRNKCYEICEKNAQIYTEFGYSYVGEYADDNDPQHKHNKSGSEVCGKCVVGAPCTFRK